MGFLTSHYKGPLFLPACLLTIAGWVLAQAGPFHPIGGIALIVAAFVIGIFGAIKYGYRRIGR